jgi:threonine dehydratase
MLIPTFDDIVKAHSQIKNTINHTPVLTSTNINELLNTNIFFKCENFQKVGAFKFRGATNAVLNMNNKELKNGVATHSSGNHAAALALAAKIRNTKAYIVMPNNAPEVKKSAVKSYGAEIIFCEPTLEARESTLNEVVKKTGATFIHPYDNYNVICGQGTAAKELLEEIPDLDTIIAPVGGGGLLSGTSISGKSINPNIKIIAAEPKGADDAFRSFRRKELVPSINPITIADGLLTSLSDMTFEIILKNVDDIITVKEESIIQAMHLVWERMKIIIEPSSAVPLASILENKQLFEYKKIGIIISGGNVDLKILPF